MATADSGNLTDELEMAFKSCLATLTNPDQLNISDPDEVKTGVEQTIHRFLDVAKQMECFFLQKRLLFSVQKPELIVREDILELRGELSRKEQLLQKHYEKLRYWQNILSELKGAPRSSSHSNQPNPTHHPNQPPPVSIQQNIPSVTTHPPNVPQHVPTQLQYQNIPPQHQVQSTVGSQSSGLQGPLAYLEQTTSNIGIVDHVQR